MGTDFGQRFKAQLPAIEQAIAEMPGDESTQIPGLTKSDLVNFCKSFEPLLEQVDTARGLDRAALAYGASNVPEQVLATLTNGANQAPNGIEHFIQNYLSTLLDLRNRLEAATGGSASEDITPNALKRRLQSLERLFEEAATKLEQLDEQRSKIDARIVDLTNSAEAFEGERANLEAVVEEVGNLRAKAQELVDGTAEGDSSIADLQKSIINVSTKANERLAKLDEALNSAKESAASATQAKTATTQIQSEARKALDEARHALRGSTQAGLAESFITERDSKLKGLLLYGGALTIALIGASLFAVKEVLPVLSEFTGAIATGQNNIGALAISLSLRTILLAPFVFLAWFAALQYRRIDLLRIDYAAKVAVAKAYVGYKDEVKGDPKLLAALKHFLIQRFGEHPVRLVSKQNDEEIPLGVFGLDTEVKPASEPARRRGTRPQAPAGQ